MRAPEQSSDHLHPDGEPPSALSRFLLFATGGRGILVAALGGGLLFLICLIAGSVLLWAGNRPGFSEDRVIAYRDAVAEWESVHLPALKATEFEFLSSADFTVVNEEKIEEIDPEAAKEDPGVLTDLHETWYWVLTDTTNAPNGGVNGTEDDSMLDVQVEFFPGQNDSAIVEASSPRVVDSHAISNFCFLVDNLGAPSPSAALAEGVTLPAGAHPNGCYPVSVDGLTFPFAAKYVDWTEETEWEFTVEIRSIHDPILILMHAVAGDSDILPMEGPEGGPVGLDEDSLEYFPEAHYERELTAGYVMLALMVVLPLAFAFCWGFAVVMCLCFCGGEEKPTTEADIEAETIDIPTRVEFASGRQ